MNKKVIWKGLILCFSFVVIILQGNKVFAANDSFANATSISVNKVVTDKMAYTNSADYNYYKFTISSPGYISLSFTHAEEESTNVGWNINLYNANKESIVGISSKRSQTSATSNNIGLPAGTYYVRVDNQYLSESTINYQLKVNYTASNAWETEYNDSFLTADVIKVNQIINGSMMYSNSTDDDYYKFTISAPGYISISFSHAEEESTSRGWDIYLYNSEEESMVGISSKRSQRSATSNNIGLPAGTYYIRVGNQYLSESTIDYQLKVNYVASNRWETEYNNSFLTADALYVNQVVNGSMVYSDSTDYDYYKFTINASGYISLNFGHAEEESTSVGWDIDLYDINKEYIVGISSKRSQTSATSNHIGLPAGTYYIKVGNQYLSESTINYQLKVNYSASNVWETEYNDGFLSADDIKVNQTINGSMMYSNSTDYDYYKVNLSKSGYIVVNFKHNKLESTSICWCVSIYDINRNYISGVDVKGHEKSTTLGMIYMSAGTYYVRVDNKYLTESTIDYQLKVNYTTPKANMTSAKSTSSKKMTVKWKKLKGVSGYQIVTATDKKFKKNKKVTNVNGSKKKKATIKKLKKKKTYYVKMRGYITVNGQKYYGAYCKAKKVTVK